MDKKDDHLSNVITLFGNDYKGPTESKTVLSCGGCEYVDCFIVCSDGELICARCDTSAGKPFHGDELDWDDL